jgi:hypothetical protein
MWGLEGCVNSRAVGSRVTDLNRVSFEIACRPLISPVMHLDLSDEEAAALTEELANITGNDRYPFSERLRTLKAALAKLRPEPVRQPFLAAVQTGDGVIEGRCRRAQIDHQPPSFSGRTKPKHDH